MQHPALSWLDQFILQQVIPHADLIEETHAFPKAWFQSLREEKYFGLIVPERDGGLGLPLEIVEPWVYKLALASPGLTLAMGSTVLSAYLLARHAGDSLRPKLLPDLCRGEKFCVLAFSEAGRSGSAIATLAVADEEGGYRLTGLKQMISGAGDADYGLVLATVAIPETESRRPALFLVPLDSPGVSFGPLVEKMAFPPLVVRDLRLDQVRVPAENLLGSTGLGLAIADEGWRLGRLCVSTVALAIAQSALEDAALRAVRPCFGRSRLADQQAVQFMLAEMRIAVEASRHLLHAAWEAWAKEAPETASLIAMAKVHVSRTVVTVADAGLQLEGGAGYLKGSAAERRYRQARLFGLVEGTTESLITAIAHRLLADSENRGKGLWETTAT